MVVASSGTISDNVANYRNKKLQTIIIAVITFYYPNIIYTCKRFQSC